MKKILWFFCLIALTFPALAEAGNTIYTQPNNPGNFVKVEKFKPQGKEVLNQPHTFTDSEMRGILRSLKYGKKLILLKDSPNRDIFELEYIDKYTPYLIEAFSKATPEQAVVWSVVQKRPYFILRNDKLTMVRMWVVGSELHISFIKTEAKLQGDYQAKTTGQRLIEEAKGIGVNLEPQQSQKFALDSTEELILDLNANWQQIADSIDAEDERLKAEAEAAKKGKKTAQASGTTSSSASSAPAAAPTPVSAKDQGDAQERLSELKSLKDKGLINQKDYDEKKQEILKGL